MRPSCDVHQAAGNIQVAVLAFGAYRPRTPHAHKTANTEGCQLGSHAIYAWVLVTPRSLAMHALTGHRAALGCASRPDPLPPGSFTQSQAPVKASSRCPRRPH